MRKYLIIFLLAIIGLGIYVILQIPTDESIKVVSKNYGTINTSLGSPFLGIPNAPITIMMFGNYQCNQCKIWFQEIRLIIISDYIDQGKINMVFIDTEPPTKIALLESIASFCANEQNKYWEYHNMLFLQPPENEIDISVLKEFASKISLDTNSFEKCLNSEKYEKKIRYITYEAKKNGIDRLPTFIIINDRGNYEKIVGLQPYSTFKEKIESMQ